MPALDLFRLDGRVALVTGASQGIGAGIVRAYAEAGADLALASRSVAELERLAEELRRLGRRVVVIPTDVSDRAAIQPMVDRTLDELGGLHILANVAGVNRRRDILDVTHDDWDFVMDVNLRATYFAAQAAARAMRQSGGGKILNIASMTSYRGFSGVSVYGASKAAVLLLTRSMAVEWARHNIQVNAIAPGWILTPMVSSMTEARRQWVLDHTPQHRMGTPEDIGSLAVYLCSAAADFITGQTYPVDGGFTAGNPWPDLKAGD